MPLQNNFGNTQKYENPNSRFLVKIPREMK